MKYESKNGGFFISLNWNGFILELSFNFRGKYRLIMIHLNGYSFNEEP